MSERWERELRKLRGIEVDAHTVRERVQRGPSADRRPPRRDRLVAGVVAFAVFGAAGAFAWRALSPTGTSGPVFGPGSWPVATVSLGSGPEGKSATLSVGGSTQAGVFGASTSPDEPYPYAWVNPTLPTLAQPLPVPMGSELELEGDVTIRELLYGDAEQLDAGRGPDSGPIWADQPDFSEPYFLPWDENSERTYLKFFGTWADGSVLDVYFEVVFVAPEADLSDPTADIVVTPEPMSAVFVYGGQRSPMGVEAGTYGNRSSIGEFVGFDERAIVAKVPAGTPLEVSGEHLVDASVRAGNLPLGEGARPLDGAVPADPGRYVLRMEVTWDGGGATFLHQIEVVAVSTPPEPSPSPAPIGEGAVVVNILRSSEETGDPEATARLGDQEVWMCPDGWTVVNPDGTEESVLFDCGQEEDFAAAAGAPVMVSGDFETIDVTAVGHEDRTQYAPNEVPGLDPGSIVTFTFDVEWADGSEASFWLLLMVAEGPPTEEASVLEVRCGPEGAEILTPVVAAQPDGVHIEVDNAAGAESLEFTEVVSPDGWFGGPIDGMVRAWPIEPGMFYVECLDSLAETYQGLETARFEVVDPNGYWVPGIPECREEDPLMKVNSYESGGADYVDDETTIRSLLHSIEPMDAVRLPFYPEGGGAKDLRYVVVRDDHVIAALHVGLSDDQDPYGPGLTEVTGQACASSGIAQGSIG